MSSELQQRLEAAGLSHPEIQRKCGLFQRATEAVRAMGGGHTGQLYRRFIPGRLEVLGKHTDYAGGRSLLSVVERGFCVVASPRSDSNVQIRDVVRDRLAQLTLSPQCSGASADWTVYPRTVLSRLARNFPPRFGE